MADYIPLSDGEFDVWQRNFLAITGDNFTAWGIPSSDLEEMKVLQTTWMSAWAKANKRQNRTAADVPSPRIYNGAGRGGFLIRPLSYYKDLKSEDIHTNISYWNPFRVLLKSLTRKGGKPC
jgi:hypothetical protein